MQKYLKSLSDSTTRVSKPVQHAGLLTYYMKKLCKIRLFQDYFNLMADPFKIKSTGFMTVFFSVSGF